MGKRNVKICSSSWIIWIVCKRPLPNQGTSKVNHVGAVDADVCSRQSRKQWRLTDKIICILATNLKYWIFNCSLRQKSNFGVYQIHTVQLKSNDKTKQNLLEWLQSMKIPARRDQCCFRHPEGIRWAWKYLRNLNRSKGNKNCWTQSHPEGQMTNLRCRKFVRCIL